MSPFKSFILRAGKVSCVQFYGKSETLASTRLYESHRAIFENGDRWELEPGYQKHPGWHGAGRRELDIKWKPLMVSFLFLTISEIRRVTCFCRSVLFLKKWLFEQMFCDMIQTWVSYHNGRRLALVTEGRRPLRKGVMTMSDFELLTLVLLIMTLVVAVFTATKK